MVKLSIFSNALVSICARNNCYVLYISSITLRKPFFQAAPPSLRKLPKRRSNKSLCAQRAAWLAYRSKGGLYRVAHIGAASLGSSGHARGRKLWGAPLEVAGVNPNGRRLPQLYKLSYQPRLRLWHSTVCWEFVEEEGVGG